GSNFLELHNEFSSLWCIKDRDPKQVERKVLSFQRHYRIPPPGVMARLTIFWFLLSFRYFVWKCEVYVWIVYAQFFVYSFFFVLVRRGGFALPSPSQRKALGHLPRRGRQVYRRQSRQSLW